MLAQPKAQRKATNTCVVHHSKFQTSMSALGQKRTLGHLQTMSALPPKADINRWHREACFVHWRYTPAAKDISYSITLVARASTVAGTVRPRGLAAFKLIERSNSVGRSTGISAGFVPFIILSTNT